MKWEFQKVQVFRTQKKGRKHEESLLFFIELQGNRGRFVDQDRQSRQMIFVYLTMIL